MHQDPIQANRCNHCISEGKRKYSKSTVCNNDSRTTTPSADPPIRAKVSRKQTYTLQMSLLQALNSLSSLRG